MSEINVEDFHPDRPPSFDVERDKRASVQALADDFIDGHCNICGTAAHFAVLSPALREHILCPHDGCSGRKRALAIVLSYLYFGVPGLDLSETIRQLSRERKRVYLAETATSLYRQFREYLSDDLFLASEYFGDDIACGTYVNGIRHENLERTSFEDGAFDLVITSDVMEHVADAIAAEREIVRLLRRSGRYVFTVPLDSMGPDDIILSEKRPDGTIVHFGEPVYHGDPNRPEGILAYRIFALRDLERRFRDLGCSFSTYRVWSQEYGVLGPDMWVHVVKKG